MSRIAIIGAGISGLAAAHRRSELHPADDLTVFESGDRAGGVLATETVDDFRIEAGPDSMLSTLPWGIDLCRRLGLTEQLIGTCQKRRNTWIVRSGRLLPIPDGLAIMAPSRLWPTIRSPILSVTGKIRLACERLIAKRTAPEDESLADFAERRVGREAFERLVQPLVSGIYMADPQRLSMQAALPRFVQMEQEHGSLIRAARQTAAGPSPQTNGNQTVSLPPGMFVAPRHGMASLIDALTQRLPPHALRLRSRVTRLTRHPAGGWKLFTSDARGEPAELFDGVIIATPSGHTANLLKETEPSLATDVSRIEHSGCIVVTVAFPRSRISHPLNGHGFVVPHVERRDIIACTFSSTKYSNRAPDDQILLRVFLGGATRPDLMHLDDMAIKETVLRELSDLLGVRTDPTLLRIVRWPGVMPQYCVGHSELVSRIEAAVAMIPQLELAGNSWRGVGIPHCIHSGEQAAERLTASRHQSRTIPARH